MIRFSDFNNLRIFWNLFQEISVPFVPVSKISVEWKVLVEWKAPLISRLQEAACSFVFFCFVLFCFSLSPCFLGEKLARDKNPFPSRYSPLWAFSSPDSPVPLAQRSLGTKERWLWRYARYFVESWTNIFSN